MLYLRTTTDELELPVAIANSAKELAEMLNTKNNLLWEAIPYNAIECTDAIRMMQKSDYEVTGAKTKKEAR